MFSQKVAQQSLRRLAVQQPYAMRWSMMRGSPAAIALGKNVQTRSVSPELVPFAVVSTAAMIGTPRSSTSSATPGNTDSPLRQATSSPNTEDPTQILAKQRLNRPVSPHLSIYRPQITWVGSSLHRVTGIALSGSLYLFATAYLAAPLLGWHLESASIAAAFGTLPLVVKVLAKGTLALPFTYHSFNGVRHLVWDLGRGFTNPTIIKTGWTVVGLSVASALALAFV